MPSESASTSEPLAPIVLALQRTIERERKARAVAESLVEERSEALRIAYEALREREESEFLGVLERLPSAVMLVQHEGEIVIANPAAAELLGYNFSGELVGQSWYDMIVVDEPDKHSDGSMLDAAVLLRKADGDFTAVDVVIGSSAFLGRPARIIILRDLSEQRRHHLELRYQATHDGLTGLPNRKLLLDRLSHSLAGARRRNDGLGVFFIDLDKFKFINDSLGHGAGDQVLCEIAERLTAMSRQGDTVARLGGDEFVVVCESCNRVAGAQLAQRILDALQEPIDLGHLNQVMGGSVGATFFPEDGDDAETLLKRADMAMYQAKASGRGCVSYFTMDMQQEVDHRVLLEARLRQAIFGNELQLYYQPQVDLSTGALVSVEALLRWISPHYGLVLPGRFIGVAEELHLIRQIGAWVTHAACQQIRAWHDQGLGWVRVAVNLSATELSTSEIVETVSHALQRYGLPPQCLELEITETMSISDPETALEVMAKLKSLEVMLAIDDFGVGYSNLGYLKRFPADRLKIDQSFIRGLARDGHDRAIISTIIQLAHSLSMQALAEGVETLEEARALYELGVDLIQGFWIAEALPAADLHTMLQQPRVLEIGILRTPLEAAKVLVVDDEPIILALISHILTELPVELVCVGSAEEAMHALEAQAFNAVISDYFLPGDSGVSLLARAKLIAPHMGRILITSSNDPAILREAINLAGVEHFLQKPLEPRSLITVVQDACSRPRGY